MKEIVGAAAPSRNAKVIVPLAIAAWLGGLLVSREAVPRVFWVVYVVSFAAALLVALVYLMGATGWSSLARRFGAPVPFSGVWRLCPTGQMAPVSVHHPGFRKVKMRFVGGSLKVGTTADALHLAMMGSGLPVLRRFFPSLHIPWRAISQAHEFEAPGWYSRADYSGLQMNYDPNYTGKFIEMEVGDPTVYIQLPAWILGENLPHLPWTSTPE